MRDTASPAIELIGISKSFGAVQANKGIDMSVPKGTIHGIIGENGAGKSTLMSILYGFYQADSGVIRIDDKPITLSGPQDAIRAGIGMVFQHFKLVQNMTVLENVVLGAEDGAILGASFKRARAELARLEAEYELAVDVDARIDQLGVGYQQRVEILKALYRKAEILILDEPTGVLTPDEADHLFRIFANLKREGKTIIMITHKLREIMEATDNVSVMRRGEMVATVKTADTSTEQLAELMVGRKVLLRVEKPPARPGEVVLAAEKLRVVDIQGVERLRSVDFELRAGEILGIAGVAGNGQSELLEVIGGMRPGTGVLRLHGEALPLKGRGADGRSRRKAGIGHVPEDRHREGLILPFHAWENTVFGYHDRAGWRKGALMDQAAIRDDAKSKIERYDVRPPNCWLPAESFSGGNQQKLVVAREIDERPDVLLVGQPTRGVDIGAIEFIHQEIVRLRNEGCAVLLVSVELDEIMSLSDRIIVMFDGRIMGERNPNETSERELGLMMAGVSNTAAA